MDTRSPLVRNGQATLDAALPLPKSSAAPVIRLAKWLLHFFPRIRLTPAVLMRIGVDVLLVNLAFLAALALRLLYRQAIEGVPEGVPETEPYWNSLTAYAVHAVSLTIACLGVFYLSGIYSNGRAYQGRYKVWIILQSVTAGFLLFVLFCYLVNGSLTLPRSALALAWLLALCLAIAARKRAILCRSILRLDRRLLETPSSREVRNVLVIGGAGYIGSALLPKLLKHGYHVRILDRLLYGAEPILPFLNHPRLEVHRADFRQVDKVVAAMADMDAVVHLGAIVGDPACALDEDLTIEINLTATRMIAEIAKGCGVNRFIFASTCSVYGASDDLLDECSALNPVSLYARSKIASEQILLKLATSGFGPTILRFGTIYGLSGRTRFDLVVNLLAAKAKVEGLISVFGGDQWRPFVHVDDAAEAIFSVLKAPIASVQSQIFNVGSDEQNYTIGEMAEMIRQLVPGARVIDKGPDGDRRNYRVSFEKIRKTLGLVPHWTIEQGVQQVIEAIADGRVEDYLDPIYSNVKFLKKEDPTRFVRKEQTWARDLIQQVAVTSNDGNGHTHDPYIATGPTSGRNGTKPYLPAEVLVPLPRIDGAHNGGANNHR